MRCLLGTLTLAGSLDLRKLAFTLICVALVTVSLMAQQPAAKKQIKPVTPAPDVAKKDKADTRGMQMLRAAEADAGALEGGMAAFALLQVARGYSQSDKPKMIGLLERSLAATRPIENDSYGGVGQRARLQTYIMRELIGVAPGRVDELLPLVEPEARVSVLGALLSYYEAHKQFDRAVQVLYRIAAEQEMPYEAAGRLMSAIPPERHSDLLQIFTTALASYRDHKEHTNSGDFPALVVKFKDQLPPAIVREGIDEVLAQAADELKDSGGKRGTFSMSSPYGSATFGSMYEFRLFQLLPLLQELDAAAAEKLLKQYREVAAQLEKYPLGLRGFQASADKQRDTVKTEFATSPVWSIRGPRATVASRMAEFSKASSLTIEAEQHPDDALAGAETITSPGIRCYAYEAIARAALDKDRAVAKTATRKLLDTIDAVEGIDAQLMLLRAAVELYLHMGDDKNAKATLERGFALAAKAYRQDSNADEPNTALKAFWPSATAYRWFCGQAAQLSPEWATDSLANVSDPDLRVLGEIAMAHRWLKVREAATAIIVAHKDRTDVMAFE